MQLRPKVGATDLGCCGESGANQEAGSLMTKLTGRGVCFLIGISLLSLGGCRKSPAPEGPERLYQVHHSAPVAPVNFIHKTFKVSTSTKFEFDVPPHALNPKLAGTFKAYSAGNPDEPAPLDLLLLTCV